MNAVYRRLQVYRRWRAGIHDHVQAYDFGVSKPRIWQLREAVRRRIFDSISVARNGNGYRYEQHIGDALHCDSTIQSVWEETEASRGIEFAWYLGESDQRDYGFDKPHYLDMVAARKG